MKTTEWDDWAPHFAPEEFLSPEGRILFHRNIIPFDPVVLNALEIFRILLNHNRMEGFIPMEEDKEITLVINSNFLNGGNKNLRGFVTPYEWYAQRTKKPGQLYSYHLWCAADVSSPEVNSEILFHYAKLTPFQGIIKYPWGVHLDMRKGDQYIKEL